MAVGAERVRQSRGPGRPGVVPLLALLLGLALPLTPGALRAQQEGGISLERIELLLNARQSTQAILQLIETNEFCLAFQLDEEARERLRAAGGDDALLEGLGDVDVCGEEEPEEEAVQEEPQAREEPAEPPREEATPAAGATVYSPASAALRSLLVPGLGQFYTGSPAVGGLFLAGWAGALGYGFMSQEVTIYCLAPATDACPSGQVRNEVSERPNLMVGLGVAAALAVGSALHARSAASKANARTGAGGSAIRPTGIRLRVLPPSPPPRPNDLVLLQVRF